MVKGNGIKLVRADDRTVSTFDMMKNQLVEAFTNSDVIELDLGNHWKVDSSMIELICSAHRVADSLGKSFTFSSAATVDRIRELANDSGYSRIPCKYRRAGCLYHDLEAGTAVNMKK